MKTISRPKIIGVISSPPYVQSSPPMPDAEGAQSPPAAHRDDSLATNPSAGLVAEDHPPKRRRGGWGRAGVFAVAAWLAWLVCPTAAFALTLTLNVDDNIAGDNTINIAEKESGFTIRGDTGTESGASVTVTITGVDPDGSATPTGTLTAISDASGDWSVDVPGDADYIAANAVSTTVSATASKTGYTDAPLVSRPLTVDLTAPTVSYNTVPSNLYVGVSIVSMSPDPNNSSEDIASYMASNLPLVLTINQDTGAIRGIPNILNNSTQTSTVTVIDTSGNTGTVMITFPKVEAPSTVTILPQTLMVPEGGSAEYTVVLDILPTHEVKITAELADGGDNDLRLTESEIVLTFTPENWNEKQIVKVWAAEDDDGKVGTKRIIHSAESDDSSYNRIPINGVRATEDENDLIGVTVRPQVLRIPDGGSAKYEVVLNTSPGETVVITVVRDQGGETDLTATPDELQFTNLNWSVVQEVTVSAMRDADQVDGYAVFSHNAGGDEDYDNIPIAPVTVIEDETRPRVEIQTEASAPVGGPFEVTIGFSEPVAGFELEDIEVSNGTASNFNRVSSRTYTVTITPEATGEVRVEVGSNVARDGVGNGNQAARPFIIETVIAVSYAAESYTAREGGEAVRVTVKLSQAWDEELAIPIRVTRPEATEAGDYTVEDLGEWDAQEGTGTLTFPAEETEQTFTITANHDGDGEDETVELGFGELPEIVIAGEPGVATVTLEDKGLVELKVSFRQTVYLVMEGQKSEIELTVSPPADRRVEVPLVVAFKGGATDEDYTGVPASVVFEAGESQRTISIEVLMDDVNDPGERIVLSLGGLPEAVSKGDPFSTQVYFEDRRAAKQFSQTLEGMAAVMARSMGESAQTAIEGRFERHRQWSRLEAAGGALPTAQPGSDDSATGLSPRESERIGGEGARDRGAGRVYRQDRLYASGLGDELLGPGPWDFSEMGDGELSLAGVSLELPLAGQQKGTSRSWVPALWGQGYLQRFNGDLTRLGMEYRGGLEAAHVGLDLYANDQVLAGLSFMRSWGDLDYTADGIDGVLESRMNTVHPYLYWQPTERVSVWGMGGLGGGRVDVNEPGRTHDFDADFGMFAGGVRAVLSRRGSNEWGLRADAFTAQLKTDALEDIAKVSGEAHRGRLMLEWVYDKALSVGRSLSLKAEAGGRFDGGDADRGSGVETGFRLGYVDVNSGLDVALRGRVLVVHESDYRDWGLGVQASWDPGEKQRGFRASVMSSLGQDGGGRTTLWDNADAVMRPEGMGIGSQYRMESEVAYAGMKVAGLPGMLTSYSRLRWAVEDRELALGTEWSLPARSQQALPSTLKLETVRRESGTGPADLGVLTRISFSF